MSNLAEQIRDTPTGRMRIISIEGLIGFKLQGLVSDAMRTREAGALFQPCRGDACGAAPFAEWLSLMEVVQILVERQFHPQRLGELPCPL